jgi:hypothetical protein
LDIGITVILAAIGIKKLFSTVNGAILPVPLAAIPMAGLVLVHWYKVPLTSDPVNEGKLSVPFPHTT